MTQKCARQVPVRCSVPGNELDDVPELSDGVVLTAEGHEGDSQLHHRADVVRTAGKVLLKVDNRFVEFLLPRQGFGEKSVRVAV